MLGSSWPGEKYKKEFGIWVQRIQNVLKVFAKLFIDDDKSLFHFEWSNGIKCTYSTLR